MGFDTRRLAQDAVEYVLGRITAANWDRWRGESNTYEDTRNRADMNALDRCVYDDVRGSMSLVARLAERRLLVEAGTKALQHGCGNCGEMSAAALLYLRNRGFSPIDYLSLRPLHAVLVLGRHSTSLDPATWGSGVWICDPWTAGLLREPTAGVLPASQLIRHIERYFPFVKEFHLRMRWDERDAASHRPDPDLMLAP